MDHADMNSRRDIRVCFFMIGANRTSLDLYLRIAGNLPIFRIDW